MTVRRAIGRLLFFGLIAAVIAYAVFPFYWAIVSSLKSGSSLFEVEFWPSQPTTRQVAMMIASWRKKRIEKSVGEKLVSLWTAGPCAWPTSTPESECLRSRSPRAARMR